MNAQLADYGIYIQYGRDDVNYDTWYSDWSRALAKRHTLPELEILLTGNRKEAAPAARSHLRAIDATHSMTSQSQRRAQTGNTVRAIGEGLFAIRGAIEIHFLFPEHALAGNGKANDQSCECDPVQGYVCDECEAGNGKDGGA